MHIKERPHYINVWSGKTVVDWAKQMDSFTDEDIPGFKAIWDEVKEEVLL
jgi:hypothetical protein